MRTRKKKQPAAQRFLIQIEHPQSAVRMEQARALLEPAGVTVDQSYGPLCVNPKLGRYVVRGTATEAAKSVAEQLEGVRFFADAAVAPAKA